MSEAISIRCPDCQARLSLREMPRSGAVRCPKCKTVIPLGVPGGPASGQGSAIKTGAVAASVIKTGAGPGQGHEAVAATKPTAVTNPAKPNLKSAGLVGGAGPSSGGVVMAPPAMGEVAPLSQIVSPNGMPPPPEALTATPLATPPTTPTTATSAPASETDDPLIGRTLAGYVVIRQIGKGGMGSVYEARQLSLDRSVAIKVLPESLSGDPEFLVRFTREALAAARLGHHNVVQVFDVAEAEGIHFFSMELVRGETLQQRRKREGGRLAVDKVAGFILQAARGLQYAHERGIVHRDIKPANLMLNEQGLIKVADLGLAKQAGFDEEGFVRAAVSGRQSRSESFLSADLTTADATLGTMGFMAPEQIDDPRGVDGRADIYALGVTMHNLITGKMPFAGRKLSEVRQLQLAEAVPSLPHARGQMPDELLELLQRMLTPDVKGRPGSMSDVIAVLEGWLEKSGRALQPTAHQAGTLEEISREYAARSSQWGAWVAPWAGAAVVAATLVTALVMGRGDWLVGAVAATVGGLSTFAALCGLLDNTYTVWRIRRHLLSLPLRDWGQGVLLSAAVVGGVCLMGQGRSAGIGLTSGAILAGAYFFLLYRRGNPQLAALTERTWEVVRQLRLRGMDEIEIQNAVVRYGGKTWPLLFEAVFGYGAMIEARGRLVAGAGPGAPGGRRTLRDRLLEWLDTREADRQANREARRLAEAEQRAAAAARTEEQRKAQAEARQREAQTMQKIAALAAQAAQREAHLQLTLEQERLVAQAAALANAGPAAPAAPTAQQVARQRELERTISAATGLAPTGGGGKLQVQRQVSTQAQADAARRQTAREADDDQRLGLVGLATLPFQLIMGRLPRLVIGVLLVVVSLSHTTPEVSGNAQQAISAAVDLGREVSGDLISDDLAASVTQQATQAALQAAETTRMAQQDDRLGLRLNGQPTVNALLAGALLIAAAFVRGRLAEMLLVSGAALMWPAGWLANVAGIDVPHLLPAVVTGPLAGLFLGLQIVTASVFWVGFVTALAGVVVWCLSSD